MVYAIDFYDLVSIYLPSYKTDQYDLLYSQIISANKFCFSRGLRGSALVYSDIKYESLLIFPTNGEAHTLIGFY